MLPQAEKALPPSFLQQDGVTATVVGSACCYYCRKQFPVDTAGDVVIEEEDDDCREGCSDGDVS